MRKGIITADWHLRSTVPQCCSNPRGEWMEIQRSAVGRVVELAIENDADVFIVGDLFHNASEVSFECLDIVLDAADLLNSRCGRKFHYIAGNHDLKNHSITNLKDSACGILSYSPNCVLLDNVSAGKVLGDAGASSFGSEPADRELVFMHVLCVPDKPDFVDCETPGTLAGRFSKARGMFLGDYHRKFAVMSKNSSGGDCLVLNPGCLTVQASDFEDYEPSVYLVDFDDLSPSSVRELPVPVDGQRFVLDRGGKLKDESVEVFVEAVRNSEGMTLDYVSNLKNAVLAESGDVRAKVESWV